MKGSILIRRPIRTAHGGSDEYSRGLAWSGRRCEAMARASQDLDVADVGQRVESRKAAAHGQERGN